MFFFCDGDIHSHRAPPDQEREVRPPASRNGVEVEEYRATAEHEGRAPRCATEREDRTGAFICHSAAEVAPARANLCCAIRVAIESCEGQNRV